MEFRNERIVMYTNNIDWADQDISYWAEFITAIRTSVNWRYVSMTYIHLGNFHALPLKAACGCLDGKATYIVHRNTCDVLMLALLNLHRTDSALTGKTMLCNYVTCYFNSSFQCWWVLMPHWKALRDGKHFQFYVSFLSTGISFCDRRSN